jgi:hypothetical protein
LNLPVQFFALAKEAWLDIAKAKSANPQIMKFKGPSIGSNQRAAPIKFLPPLSSPKP